MRWILFVIFVGLFLAMVGATIWTVFFTGPGLLASDRPFITRLLIGEVAIAVITLFYALFNLRRSATDEVQNRPGASFVVKSYPRSQHPEFFKELEQLLQGASTIVLISVGLNFLWEMHLVELLIRRALSGTADITICMGNTSSPHVEDRLIEEELGDNRPPVGRSGIDGNVRSLAERVELAGEPKNLQVRLFEHYPTFATLMFDRDIFVYPYGYQILGNMSPIFHLRDDGSEEVKFFVENAQRILRDSVPAKDVVTARRNRRHYSDQWIGAAVYIIPEGRSEFYRLGTSILGYDVRAERDIPDESLLDVSRYAGEAAGYGFHATLADALLFATEAQIDRVRAELKFLSEEFQPFRLSELEVAESPQDASAVVVKAKDRSGSAEAIQHELVTRVYRTSISSTFLAGRTKKPIPANDQRARLMLDRYGSPYILKALELHFTLCSSAPPPSEERDQLLTRLKTILAPVVSSEVEVEELVLMLKRPDDPRWKMEETFPLHSSK